MVIHYDDACRIISGFYPTLGNNTVTVSGGINGLTAFHGAGSCAQDPQQLTPARINFKKKGYKT
jgi:hypothetical protein